jgi:hypothetical protein
MPGLRTTVSVKSHMLQVQRLGMTGKYARRKALAELDA